MGAAVNHSFCDWPKRWNVQRGRSEGRQRTWWNEEALPDATVIPNAWPAWSNTFVVKVPVRGPCPSTSTVVPDGEATFTVTATLFVHRRT